MHELSYHRRVSVAPMMEWTDRHCRYFLRLLSPDVLLYTEMVTAAALIHGDADRLLEFRAEEHPVALQLGGSDPALLAGAAKLGEQADYNEINLNIGCPSPRVQSGSFGACLMADPQLVADCVAAMAEAVDIPITVKTRIGIDDHDSYEFLRDFVATVADAGCEVFIIHARKALLSGMSPKENRQAPPLVYERAYRIKQEFPNLAIVVNGGIDSTDQVGAHLEKLDGVMIGRHAYHHPFWLCQAQRQIYPETKYTAPNREQVLRQMNRYLQECAAQGVRPHAVTRHMMGLYAGEAGGKRWRRFLSEQVQNSDAGSDLLLRSLAVFAS